MAKPIFLIGFPLSADNDAVYGVQRDLSQKLEGEYHVIAYKIQNIEAIDFKVLNAINATDAQLEELIEKTSTFTEQLMADYQNKLNSAFNDALNVVQEIKNNPENNDKI